MRYRYLISLFFSSLAGFTSTFIRHGHIHICSTPSTLVEILHWYYILNHSYSVVTPPTYFCTTRIDLYLSYLSAYSIFMCYVAFVSRTTYLLGPLRLVIKILASLCKPASFQVSVLRSLLTTIFIFSQRPFTTSSYNNCLEYLHKMAPVETEYYDLVRLI